MTTESATPLDERFSGKAAVIAGASRGIGAVTAGARTVRLLNRVDWGPTGRCPVPGCVHLIGSARPRSDDVPRHGAVQPADR